MKKLMIVAAVATMAGALVAADGYDFTASVKTTKGKAGSQKTTYTVNCGLDANGVYWWDGLGYSDANDGKKNAKKDYGSYEDLAAALNFDETTGECDYNVQEIYKGKARWCYTFKYSRTDDDCYRVAGSQKLKGVVEIDACCNGTWEFVSADGYLAESLTDNGFGDVITPVLLYRFGGVTAAKATKVEFVGTIGDFTMVNLDKYTDCYDGAFALAGQGAWDAKNEIIKNISGNIVGVLQNPDCESCCNYDESAIVFECDVADEQIGAYQDVPNGTAAFGTFSLKYNKNY